MTHTPWSTSHRRVAHWAFRSHSLPTSPLTRQTPPSQKPMCLLRGLHEAPSAHERAFEQLGPPGASDGVIAMNGSDYLAAVAALGVAEVDFPAVQWPPSKDRLARASGARRPRRADPSGRRKGVSKDSTLTVYTQPSP
jgi:hypothetical protein